MKTQFVTGIAACLMLAACAHHPRWEDVDNDLPDNPSATAPAPNPLLSMSSSDLKELLGKPDFVHTEKNSQIWRYDTASCRVLFYLYTDNNRLAVRQYQSLPDGKPGKLSRTCRSELKARAG